MADYVLSIIPTSPSFVLDEGKRSDALDLFRGMVPDAEKVEFIVYDEVTFVHPFQNLYRIGCPKCGVELELLWWQSAMDEAYKSHFQDLEITVPCCQSKTSLNDIDYKWTAGFASFALQASYLSRGFLSESEIKQLEDVVGSPLRQVYARI